MNKPRAFFKQELPKLGVKVLLNNKIDSLEVEENKVLVNGKRFDWAVNCTSYQNFNPLTKFMGAKICY